MNTSRKSDDPLGKTVATAQNVQRLQHTSTDISGTTTSLRSSLKEIELELRKEKAGQKEFEDYLTAQLSKKADLEKRVAENRAWIDNYEKQNSSGAFEDQYKRLLSDIQTIYGAAVDFHAKGIDMLIKDFGYHLAFKRWNDTFSAVPFKPRA